MKGEIMIKVEKEDKVHIISFETDHVDSGNFKMFKETMQEHIRDGGDFLFDIGALKFIDSSGLGAFLSILRDLQGKEGKMKICSPTPAVKILFELVRLQKIIEVHETKD